MLRAEDAIRAATVNRRIGISAAEAARGMAIAAGVCPPHDLSEADQAAVLAGGDGRCQRCDAEVSNIGGVLFSRGPRA